MCTTRLEQCFLASATVLYVLGAASGCSKSRADDFSRFRPTEAVQTPGAAPRSALRYRPPAAEDVAYHLSVRRQCPALGHQSRMRLRATLRVDTQGGGGGPFALRLVSLQRLDPPPPGGPPDLGPSYVLLRGRLGPRGRLHDVQEGDQLPSPLNMSLAMPLLLPHLPEPAVGVGAKWRASRKEVWKRRQAADALTNQPELVGAVEVLISGAYHLSARDEAQRPVIGGKLTFRLRSRTRALGHRTRHHGTGAAQARYVLDPATGMPVHAKVTLEGTYQLSANDTSRTVKETLEITLGKE